MPRTQSVSALPPFLFLLFLTLLFHFLRRKTFRTTHDEPLQLRSSSPLFSYTTSTSRNLLGNRCALLRCLSVSDSPSLPRTSCDIVSITATPQKANVSQQLCIVDYVLVHWDALSRTFNDGIFYASRTIKLRHDPAKLPIFGKAVHFPLARDSHDISPAWFSVFPSNMSQAVFKAWHNNAQNLPKNTQAPPHHIALNRARNCRNKDVECHPRDAAIAHACDGLPGIKTCDTDPVPAFISSLVLAVTIVIALQHFFDTLGGFIPRRRLYNLRTLVGSNLDPARKEMLTLSAFAFTALVMLAGIPRWPDIFASLARPLSVSVRHRLQNVHLHDPLDAFAGSSDLRGKWDGHAYIMADGAHWVRISGPGAAFVVMLFGWVMQLREAFETGLLFRCLLAIVGVRLLCLLVKAVGGVSERRLEEQDEYATRLEAAMFRRGKERNRSFLSQSELLERDRARATSKKTRV